MYEMQEVSWRPSDADTRVDFDAWVRPHLAVMRRLAVVAAPAEDPDEVVQEALVRAWQRWSTFDGRRGAPRTWLLAITADRARRRRLRARTFTLTPLDSDFVVPEMDLASRVDLEQAIRALPRRQRHAVVLHYLVGLTISEVATLMRCAPGTVKSGLSDARRSLARVLGDDDA